MRNGRRAHAPLSAPGAPVKDPGQRGQQHVLPIEVRGSLVEMRQSEQARGYKQSPVPAQAFFQQILQPAAEKQLLRDRDKKEGEKPREGNGPDSRPTAVHMQEAKAQAQPQRKRRVENRLAQPDPQIL